MSQVLVEKCDSLTDVQEILSLMDKLNASQAENARLKVVEAVSRVLVAKCDSLTDVQETLSLMDKLNASQAENARLKVVESIHIH